MGDDFVDITTQRTALTIALAAATALPAYGQSLNDVATCFADQVADPATSRISGISTVVLVDDQVVMRRGFGTVAPGNPRPVTAATRFRTASTLKMMTATSVLSLADAGRVNLSASAGSLLPGLSVTGQPAWFPRLTVRRLISHQGALKDFNITEGSNSDTALQDFFRVPAQAAVVPLLAPPGRFWNYSNTNFMMAGAIAERAAGKPYRQVMSERVFQPLGMHRMTFDANAVKADGDFAYGIADKLYGPDDQNSRAFEPAGLAWGSADDLAKFAQFLIKGNPAVLSPGSWNALRAPQVGTFESIGDIERYGYGVYNYNFDVVDGQFYSGVQRLIHPGGVSGFSSLIYTLPAQRFAMVVLGNGGTLAARTCVRKAIAATVKNRLPAPSPFPDPGIRSDRFGDYVGWYVEDIPNAQQSFGPHQVTLSISGQLNIRFPTLDAYGIAYSPVLTPVFEDGFVLEVQGFQFILKGFRGIGASNPQTEYLRMRLLVGKRVGYIPNLARASISTAQKADFKRDLMRKLRDAANDDAVLDAIEMSQRK
jgi:CubicO group peptidase (beta-lactamase class C family)